MAFLPAAVVDGARTYAQQIRQISYMATDGLSGVPTPEDLAVTALPTPGAAVNIAAGSGVMISTYPGGAGQAYNVTNDATFQVAVPANGSGGTVTLRVLVAVRDPQYPGMPTPGSPLTDPYLDVMVRATLPTDRPYLHLADLVMPAGASTVTNSMVTARAPLAQPRTFSDAMPYFPGTTLNMAGSYTNWPQINHTVEIPSWATYMFAKVSINGVSYTGSNIAVGGVRLSLAGTPDLQNGIITANFNGQRQTVICIGRWRVSQSIRGTTRPLLLEGMKTLGNGNFTVDYQSQIIFEWTSQERM